MEEDMSDTNEPVCPKQMGVALHDLYIEKTPWNFAVKPVRVLQSHHVLYEFPAEPNKIPLPHESLVKRHWTNDFVRMPYSPLNTMQMKTNSGEIREESRWELIKTSLTQRRIESVADFQVALNTYSAKQLPRFQLLEYFFSDEHETKYFFSNLLPKIVALALRLPDVLPGSLPLLKATGSNEAISLSQLQIASLLANAFLCTFPTASNAENSRSLPTINFTQLFAENKRDCVAEKLKCFLHYFRRVTNQCPTGCVTFERRFCGRHSVPRWDRLDDAPLGNVKLHVDSVGTIEDCHGFLQVDFANKYIGGGVLGYGCVQEEIRFAICPELIVGRLFTERLTDNEAVIVTGVERFSNYSGYADSFTWCGNYQDSTPVDAFNRRKCSITVIDAIHFTKSTDQFRPAAILRELNKAFVGFKSSVVNNENIAPVATGNWGCGAFQGDTHLKCIIQLMACAATNRNMAYYTFGDVKLMKAFHDLHAFLRLHPITITKMWRFLCEFCTTKVLAHQLYAFIQQAYFDSIKQPKINQYLSGEGPQPTTSIGVQPLKKTIPSEEKLVKQKPNVNNNNYKDESMEIVKIPVIDMVATHEDIVEMLDVIDGNDTNRRQQFEGEPSTSTTITLLTEIDKLSKEQMEATINNTNPVKKSGHLMDNL